MATLRKGSTGQDVRELQTALNGKGYTLSVDGIYGDKTAAAVRDYQQKNGLSMVDGIAGNETWGSLRAATQSSTPAQTTNNQQYGYDASGNKAYQDALKPLQEMEGTKPSYDATYDKQLSDLYEKIMNREKFSYDAANDPLYQQYREMYTREGKAAMQDTMGQASALTGGYGSTYAQSVGQQQYDAYLQKLNEVVPELYSQARQAYNDEGDRMMQQYQMVGDLRSDEYSKYRDALSDWWQGLNYQTDRRTARITRASTSGAANTRTGIRPSATGSRTSSGRNSSMKPSGSMSRAMHCSSRRREAPPVPRAAVRATDRRRDTTATDTARSRSRRCSGRRASPRTASGARRRRPHMRRATAGFRRGSERVHAGEQKRQRLDRAAE